MNYKETLEKFEKWIKIIRKSILFLAGLEVLIVLIIGVASSNIYHDKYSTFWIVILITLGIIFLGLTIFKIAYNKSFPSSLIEELKSKKDLELAELSIKRKDAINNYISRTIIDLNKCKCEIPNLSKDDDWEKASNIDFETQIKQLTNTFNNVVNVLLNTSNARFSIGIYADNFRAFNSNNDPLENTGTFLVRDDYKLNESGLINDLMTSSVGDIPLEIQNGLKVSFRNGRFLSKNIHVKDEKEILLICSNIEDLQDYEVQKGVLFIITDTIDNLPKDLESVLTMFTNIISHWFDLYEYEVVQRQISLINKELDDKIEDTEKEKLEGQKQEIEKTSNT